MVRADVTEFSGAYYYMCNTLPLLKEAKARKSKINGEMFGPCECSLNWSERIHNVHNVVLKPRRHVSTPFRSPLRDTRLFGF